MKAIFDNMCAVVGRYGGDHCYMIVSMRQGKPSSYKFTWYEEPGFEEQSITAQSLEALSELVGRWHTVHMFAEGGDGAEVK